MTKIARKTKRTLRKVKQWFVYNGRIAAIVLTVLTVLGVGVWHAVSTNDGDQKQQVDVSEDVEGDVALKEIEGLGFDEGMQLLAAGEEVKGRAVIRRLAPLTTASKKARGESDAHLWMAKDLLEVEKFGFLEVFPIDAAEGKQVSSPVELPEDELTKRCVRHLRAAVELDSQAREAVILLAEVLLAQNQRDLALEVLHRSLVKELDLGMELANMLYYKGDDLGVEEASWHAFATLGHEISGSKRGSMGIRMEYILYAMILKQTGVAKSAINKFERDFGQRTEGVKLVKNLRACLYYFKATDLLSTDPLSTGEFDAEQVVKYLLEANQQDPGRAGVVASLKLMVERYPELEELVKQGAGEVSAELESEDPLAASLLHLFLASLRADRAQEYIERAYALSPDEPAIVVEWSRYAEDSQEVEVAANRALEQQRQRGDYSEDQRFNLLLALGKVQMEKKEWMAALVSLERALASEHNQDETNLHSLLAKLYAELNMNQLASEHQKLAGK